MKMKIGIMTFWWSNDNYGQLLQCYALQQYLREQGHEPFLIRYDPRTDIKPVSLFRKIIKAFNIKNLINFIANKAKSRIYKRRVFLDKENKLRKFDEFRREYIFQSEKVYLSYYELQKDPPEADCYIVGSDQVWNFYKMPLASCKNIIHAYFLDFGRKSTKKIAYAASWGKTEIPENFIAEITPLLKQFDYISVREESGLDICKKCGIQNAEFRCDPTLLLSRNHYQNLCQSESTNLSHRKYILIYRLWNSCNFPIKKIFKWAKINNFEIIYITANGLSDSYKKRCPTIPEWIALIANAEYVITNSFHGSLFSLIFRKKFGVVPLKDSQIGMNSRINMLFKLFHVSPRWFTDNFDILNLPYNPTIATNFHFKIEELINRWENN